MMDMRVSAASATNEPRPAARTAAAAGARSPRTPRRAMLSDPTAIARKRGTARA
jgi:hypothetical protein